MSVDDTISQVLGNNAVFQHIFIGDIELGVRRDDAPDTSKPNPTSMSWSQKFKIVPKDVMGEKPVTICTCPKALWTCTMEFSTLDNRPEVLQPVIDMDAGPHYIRDVIHDRCMLLDSKTIDRVKASKDYYHVVKLVFTENNPGAL